MNQSIFRLFYQNRTFLGDTIYVPKFQPLGQPKDRGKEALEMVEKKRRIW